MSARLEQQWGDILDKVGPAAIHALLRELQRRGALDEIYRQGIAELAADQVSTAVDTSGKLAKALALIEAGAAKDAVLAAGISERTYFRARATAKTAKSHRANGHALVA